MCLLIRYKAIWNAMMMSLSMVVLAEVLQENPYAEYVKVIHMEESQYNQSATRWLACPPTFTPMVLYWELKFVL